MNIKKLIYISLFTISQFTYGIEPDSAFNMQFRQEIGGWIAADATFSILLPDGRTLWLFGDTFIGEVNENNSIKPGSRMIRNSAVIQDGDELNTLHQGTASDPDDFIPSEHPDSLWYWPEHGLVENDTLYIFLAKFREDPDAPAGFNFAHAGNDIACFTYPELQFINTVPIMASEINGTLYGDRLLEDSIFIYIYGRKNDIQNNIPYPHVARALKGELMNQQWEFYDGSTWSDDPQATNRINSFQVSQQYSVTKYLGKYILLTQDIWLSPKIFSFTSDSPAGPWKNKKLIFETPETSGNTWTYNAYAHPQFNKDGELLISYNVNGDFFSIFSNVELYRPRFIRVPYMNLDYAYWPSGNDGKNVFKENNLQVFPNPTAEDMTVSLDVDFSQSGTIELRNLKGELLKSIEIDLVPGSNHIKVEMNHLMPGMYLCRLILFNGTETIKITKAL